MCILVRTKESELKDSYSDIIRISIVGHFLSFISRITREWEIALLVKLHLCGTCSPAPVTRHGFYLHVYQQLASLHVLVSSSASVEGDVDGAFPHPLYSLPALRRGVSCVPTKTEPSRGPTMEVKFLTHTLSRNCTRLVCLAVGLSCIFSLLIVCHGQV